MMDPSTVLSGTSNSNSTNRDPLQSPVFKLRGLEMTVYGLEKENLELRQKIETHEKENLNFQKLISEYEFENGQHERRHAQLEEEILELRKQLKQLSPYQNSNNHSSNNNNNGNLCNNSNNLDMGQLKIHEKLISEDVPLYLYTGRSFPNSPSNTLANSHSFNSNHSVNLKDSNSNCNNNNSNSSNNNNNNNNSSNSNDHDIVHPVTPTIVTTSNNNSNSNSRSPFQKGNKPPSSPTIVSCVSDGVNTGVNISMSPSPVIQQPRKKSIISLFSL